MSAALARFAQPAIQLAAFGGIVYPVMLLIESPVIMLLAASTALSRDWLSYRSLRRYMLRMSVVLTLLHLLVAITPLYELIARDLIHAPEVIIGPARLGVLVAIPWTWSIAYRRFNQGILIRYGASREIGVGTLLRLVTTTSVLAAGLALGRLGNTGGLPGVAVGTVAVIVGVVAESLFIGARTGRMLSNVFDPLEPGQHLSGRDFLRFYVPLALTSLLALINQPIGSAAISRMPEALESLATWPVVIGISWVLRSGGTAYKEVVVAMLDRPNALPALRRFTLRLAVGTFAATCLFTLTPIADWWLSSVSGLDPSLAGLARVALLLALLIPVSGVLQNWYVGYLLHARQTRCITESMVAFLLVAILVLVAGVKHSGFPGLWVAFSAFTLGNLAQLAWAWKSARKGLARLQSALGASAAGCQGMVRPACPRLRRPSAGD